LRKREGTLWKVMMAAYVALNQTNPNATSSCWLCYDIRPPYYEAIGINTTFKYSTEDSPQQCNWGDQKVGITLESVKGQGVCIG
ncbi:ENV1 protein, partial [Nothoprocta pentlandii]|nr:ENV1 protein [Nothoprocta pentlandii]